MILPGHKMDRRVVGKSKTELLGPRGRYTGDEQPDSPVILMLQLRPVLTLDCQQVLVGAQLAP